MIVEDYDNDGEKEAFILANKEEKKENKFELWFLSGKNSQKLSDEFVATEDTTIELFIKNKNYIIFNVAQLRQNDSMYTEIYKVKENKAVKVFKQNKINLFLENEELYAYDYSYSVLQPEFNEWMSLSQQKYHIKWNGKKEMCQDYDVKTLSEEKFSKISKADDVKNLIKKQIKKRFFYLATLSSHFNIKSIVIIEILHATTNTVHVIQIGMDSYKIAPITNS